MSFIRDDDPPVLVLILAMVLGAALCWFGHHP